MANKANKVYIGDGVYAEYDGMGVWLTTERENGTHMIYLEPPMVERIVRAYVQRASLAPPERRGEGETP